MNWFYSLRVGDHRSLCRGVIELMICPACKNESLDPAICDCCGADLPGVLPAPGIKVPPPGASRPPDGPHQKRRTVFEPEATPPPPAAEDYFSRPLPPRPTFDPHNPFGSAPVPGPASPGEAAPVALVPPPKSRTVLQGPEAAAVAPIRGALFEFRGPTDPGRLHALKAGRNVIGRNPECDVRLEDSRSSGQHGFVFLRAKDATYMDVSTNGSIVDGQPIHGEQVTLQHSSVLKIGESWLIFVAIDESLVSRIRGQGEHAR